MYILLSIFLVFKNHMLCIRHMNDDAIALNLTKMVTKQLFMHGGLSQQQLVKKLIYVGVDRAAVF
jgi:hypothetical protein